MYELPNSILFHVTKRLGAYRFVVWSLQLKKQFRFNDKKKDESNENKMTINGIFSKQTKMWKRLIFKIFSSQDGNLMCFLIFFFFAVDYF